MSDHIELIAECGWNHMGDMSLASDMIASAAEAGADYVKFQTWKVDRLIPGPWDEDGRRQIYEKAELSEDDHHFLKAQCDAHEVKFLTSCFCPLDLDFVRTLSSEVKIPSPEACNSELVNGAIERFDRIFLSTGACDRAEYGQWADPKIVLLHCVSSYPCEPQNFHMEKFNYVHWLQVSSGALFGFSGHSPTPYDAMLAMSLGATVVEKHFTLDNDLPGRDNKFALLPAAFKQLRAFADYVVLTGEPYSTGAILDCETEYRKYHKSRWDNFRKS